MYVQRILIIIGVLITGIASFFVGYVVGPDNIIKEHVSEIVINYDLDCEESPNECAFFQVVDDLIKSHYKQPDREGLFESAIDGAIDFLGDPHTSYFSSEEAQQFRSSLGESYTGIGVEVSVVEDRIIINSVFNDSPAESVGMLANDIITHVNNENIEGLPFYDVLSQIIGEEGTDVIVGVYRPSSGETIHFNITRAVIENPTVEYQLLEEDGEDIGYIIVNSFGADTDTLFAQAIETLETDGMDSLIVDVRNNGGGYLGTVFNMMSQFLRRDDGAMFYTKSWRTGTEATTEYRSSNNEKKAYNIAVLINEGSASASEVFASGMQEQGNYTLIGVQSFGKGTMQDGLPIESITGDELHISLGVWETSDGNWVHFDGGSDGITPDIIVERTEEELAHKVTLADGEILVRDIVDKRLENIQVILNMMGYNVRTDGYFDLLTKQAVQDIQFNNGLPTTGAIDANVTIALNEFIDTYKDSLENDSQLQEAIEYLLND